MENLQIFRTEIFKVNRDLEPSIFGEFLKKRNIQYNLLHYSRFYVPSVKITFHGAESLSCLRSNIWDLVPEDLSNMNASKKAIKMWKT